MFSTGRGAVGVIALLALCVTVRGINRDRQLQRERVAGAEQCSPPAVVGDVSSTTAVDSYQLLGFGSNFNVAVVVDGCPPGTHHAGSRLVACDHDVAPRVVWFNTKRGHVLRTGNPSQVGLATVTVFCNPGSWDDTVRATAGADNRDATEGREGRPGRSFVVAEAVQTSYGEASARGQ